MGELLADQTTLQLGGPADRFLTHTDPATWPDLDRRGAELLFHILTEPEEKKSVAVVSKEFFGKAHIFWRTLSRCCRSSTGSA